ncbi:2'-5' RNA ligase family protein [Curvivirga sp.]|uniref:2'-5' RNA ligase family protein n=1 Tax=Curvivirga sp. TaxID=2856848 RepID=UPI003B5C6A3F
MKRLWIMLLAFTFVANTSSHAAEQEYNIFAVPSAEISNYVNEFGKKLKDQTDIETFEQRGYLPHATLYLTSFKASDLDEVKAKVKDLARNQKSFPLIVDGTHLTKGRWYFLDLTYSKDLQRLSDKVVLSMEPMRNLDYQVPNWVKKYPEKLKTFERYGSPNVFAQYNPHLTQLAGEKNTKLDDFITAIKDEKIYVEGQVIGLGFAPVNPLGQVKSGDEEIFLFKK